MRLLPIITKPMSIKITSNPSMCPPRFFSSIHSSLYKYDTIDAIWKHNWKNNATYICLRLTGKASKLSLLGKCTRVIKMHTRSPKWIGGLPIKLLRLAVRWLVLKTILLWFLIMINFVISAILLYHWSTLPCYFLIAF